MAIDGDADQYQARDNEKRGQLHRATSTRRLRFWTMKPPAFRLLRIASRPDVRGPGTCFQFVWFAISPTADFEVANLAAIAPSESPAVRRRLISTTSPSLNRRLHRPLDTMSALLS